MFWGRVAASGLGRLAIFVRTIHLKRCIKHFKKENVKGSSPRFQNPPKKKPLPQHTFKLKNGCKTGFLYTSSGSNKEEPTGIKHQLENKNSGWGRIKRNPYRSIRQSPREGTKNATQVVFQFTVANRKLPTGKKKKDTRVC